MSQHIEVQPFICPHSDEPCPTIGMLNNLHMEASMHAMAARAVLEVSVDAEAGLADMRAFVDDAIASHRLAQASEVADEVDRGELTPAEAVELLNEFDDDEQDINDQQAEQDLASIKSAERSQEISTFDAANELLDAIQQATTQYLSRCSGKPSAAQRVHALLTKARENITGELADYTPPTCHNRNLTSALQQLVSERAVSHGNYSFMQQPKSE